MYLNLDWGIEYRPYWSVYVESRNNIVQGLKLSASVTGLIYRECLEMVRTINGRLLITRTALRLNVEKMWFNFIYVRFILSLRIKTYNCVSPYLSANLYNISHSTRTGKGLTTNNPMRCTGYLNYITFRFGSLLALKLNQMQMDDLLLQTGVVRVHYRQHEVH